MYQVSYAEVLDETPKSARERERIAIERSIALLEKAQAQGVRSRETVDAIFFTRQLWTFFLEDLGNPENDLGPQLRGELISVGLWIMRELDQIRLEQSDNFKGIIEVSSAIRDGLH